MTTQGAFTVIVNEKNQILLVKRRDYPIWDLPGGHIDLGEEASTCAIRESFEETGYQVKIEEKIGCYVRPLYEDTQHLFLGRIVGGEAVLEGPETKELRFFNPEQLPFLMVPNRKMQIRDVVNGNRNVYQEVKESKLFKWFIEKLSV